MHPDTSPSPDHLPTPSRRELLDFLWQQAAEYTDECLQLEAAFNGKISHYLRGGDEACMASLPLLDHWHDLDARITTLCAKIIDEAL